MATKQTFNHKPWYDSINDILDEYHRKCKANGVHSYYDVPSNVYGEKLGSTEFRTKHPFKKDKCIYVKNKRDAVRDQHNRYFENIYDEASCNFVHGVWKKEMPNRSNRYGQGVCWVSPKDAKCGAFGVEPIIRKRKDINTEPLVKKAQKQCNADSDCAWSKLSGVPIDCVKSSLLKQKRSLVNAPPINMPTDITDPNNRIEQWLFDWYTKEMHGPAPQVKDLFGTGNRCVSASVAKKESSALHTKEYKLLSEADLLSPVVHQRLEQILDMIEFEYQSIIKRLKTLRAKDKDAVNEIRASLIDAYVKHFEDQSVEEEPVGYLPSIPQSVVNMVMKNISMKNSTNRGMMALHSTGSGKTCTATGVIDAFWDSDRFIIFASSIDAVASNPPFKFHECAARLYGRFKKEPFKGANEKESIERVGAAFEERGVLFHPFAKLANRITKTEKFKSLILRKTGGNDLNRPTKMVEKLAALYNKKQSVVQEALAQSGLNSMDQFIDLDRAVLVIDEVHNLFRPLPTQKAKHQLVEKHLDPKLHPNLKVVIMTATPGDNAEDVVKLLNIIRDPTHAPIKAPNVESAESIQLFKESLRGMISFFDMSSDTTQFPVVQDPGPIMFPMSNTQFVRYVEAYKEVKDTMTNYKKLAKANQLAKFWAGPRKYSNMLYQFEKKMELSEFSSKLPGLIANVTTYPKEKHYIYSAFYENRGSSQGILEIARQMEAQGYTKLTVQEARRLNQLGQLPEKGKRYVLALQKDLESGGKSIGMNLNELIKIYNHKENKDGELVHLFLATQGFNEGIDLKAVRHIHIFEPLVTMASDLQTIGRARRFCSHADLEWPNQWSVMIHRYQSAIMKPIQTNMLDVQQVESQIETLKKEIDETKVKKVAAEKRKELKALEKSIKNDLSNVKNIDEFIYNNALEKMKELVVIHQAIKEAAVDCRLLNKFHGMEKKCL